MEPRSRGHQLCAAFDPVWINRSGPGAGIRTDEALPLLENRRRMLTEGPVRVVGLHHVLPRIGALSPAARQIYTDISEAK
jgi:hypothetical protein